MKKYPKVPTQEKAFLKSFVNDVHDGNRAAAGRVLGINPNTLHRWIHKGTVRRDSDLDPVRAQMAMLLMKKKKGKKKTAKKKVAKTPKKKPKTESHVRSGFSLKEVAFAGRLARIESKLDFLIAVCGYDPKDALWKEES